MTCYVLYTTLDWTGIHTSFITCYIVSLTTVGDSIQKLLLRISGALVGATGGIATIIFVLPHMSTIDELLALVFVGAFVSAWVSGGGPRVSYAGFQIALAFFLCVIQADLAGIEDDLHLAHLEPPRLRPDYDWLAHQGLAAAEIAELTEMLLIGRGEGAPAKDAVRARLDALATAVEAGGTAHGSLVHG
jgi:hypothetical protein